MAPKKPTNKEIVSEIGRIHYSLRNLDMIMQLLVRFLGKEVEFKKFMVEWEHEQKEKMKKNLI